MSDLLKIMRNQTQNIYDTITTTLVCRVINYNESTGTAKLQPMYKDASGEMMAVLDDVPTLKQRYRIGDTLQEHVPILQNGDKVLVAFSKYALDDVLDGKVATITDNIFRDVDAVVLGVLP